MATLREQELEMRLWFSENELYCDGSNIYDWLPKVKTKIEDIFRIKLSDDASLGDKE